MKFFVFAYANHGEFKFWRRRIKSLFSLRRAPEEGLYKDETRSAVPSFKKVISLSAGSFYDRLKIGVSVREIWFEEKYRENAFGIIIFRSAKAPFSPAKGKISLFQSIFKN